MQARSKIFLVDDHPLVRLGMAEVIEATDDLTVCGEADNRVAALAGILATNPRVALVDLSLAGSSGLDLLKDLRAQGRPVRCLVVTAWDEPYRARLALDAGAAGYLVKTEAIHKLVPAIRTVLAGQSYLSRVVATPLAVAASRAVKATDSVELFSGQELEVFTRLGQGRTVGQIAVALGVVTDTVYDYCRRMQVKLGLTGGIAELRRLALRWYESRLPG